MANLTSISNMFDSKRINFMRVPGLTIKPFPIPIVLPAPVTLLTQLGPNSVIPGSIRSRPLWFNGRFLAAQDLKRDQDYFLQDQATLGQAAGFGVLHGLTVSQPIVGGEPDAQTIVIASGHGITPGGNMVMLAADLTIRIFDIVEEEDLDVQFGLSETPEPIARTRSGLYVVALRPVEFTAQPITSYPSDIQGSRQTQDGSVIEASAVSLVPYPIPAANFDSTSQNAAAARQVFVQNDSGILSDSLLPIAMISIDRGAIQWLDQWMVRRESGPESDALRFDLADLPTQQSYLRQFDAQLQQIVDPMVTAGQVPKFPASNYFQALPPAGRIPLASIDTVALTQVFFPLQTGVTLSLVPEDEMAALIDDSMSLEPIDLTLPAAAYADLAVMILISVARRDFSTLSAALQPVALSSPLPLAITMRSPIDLLRFFRPAPVPANVADGAITWATAIGTQTYGYFVRRRSVPAFVSFSLADTSTALSTAPVTGAAATQFIATVSAAAATGTVTFEDGATPIGTVDLKSGFATLVLPNLAVGAHSLTAVYNGDVNYAASTSPAVTLTI
jgi:hypothetical protein